MFLNLIDLSNGCHNEIFFKVLLIIFVHRNNFAAGWMNLGTVKAALNKADVSLVFVIFLNFIEQN